MKRVQLNTNIESCNTDYAEKHTHFYTKTPNLNYKDEKYRRVQMPIDD